MPQYISNLTTVGGALPGSWRYVPDRQGYFFVTLSPNSGSEAVLINNQGKVPYPCDFHSDFLLQVLAQNIWDPPNTILMSNNEYDFNLKKFFATSLMPGGGLGEWLVEWNPDTGAVTKLFQIPNDQGSVQVSRATPHTNSKTDFWL